MWASPPYGGVGRFCHSNWVVQIFRYVVGTAVPGCPRAAEDSDPYGIPGK